MNYKILNVNSMVHNEVMRVDHIITDPPYQISQKNNYHTMGRKGIYFGNWDQFDPVAWIKEHIWRVRPGGSVLIFCSWWFVSDVKRALENQGIQVKQLISWTKTNPMPRNRDRLYVNDREYIVWGVVPGAPWTFNRNEEKYLIPEIKTPVLLGKERTEHPTQKPIELMKRLILTHTKEGDLIFDPFAGSGSTGVACLETKRKAVLWENDVKYYEIARKRLEKFSK